MVYKLCKDINKKPYYLNTCSVAVDVSKNEIGNSEINSNGDLYLTEKDYVNVVKKIKKDNITQDNVGEIMLCQIPGVSSITALAIMEKYKTLPNLIKELELNPDAMKDLSYTNSKGQIRKINKTSTANVIKYLLQK